MARDYWVEVSVKPVDQTDDPGMSSGFRMTIFGEHADYAYVAKDAAASLQIWLEYYQEKERMRERPLWKKVLFG